MIIKGQHRTFGFWLSVSAIIFSLSLMVFWLLFGSIKFPLEVQFLLYSITLIPLIIYGKRLYDANLITVDTNAKTITFANLFTRRLSLYDFSDFDGKLVWHEPIKGGTVRNCYLIQNKRPVKKISGFIFSNQKELEAALTGIKDLGTIKYSYVRSWKAFLGVPIIE